MTFGAPQLLPWLGLVVALGWCLWLYRRWQSHTLHRWASARFLQRWGVLLPRWKVISADLSLCLAVVFLLLALARPQWGTTLKERQPQGLDLMVVLDVSPSMGLSDLRPTRWHQAMFAVQSLAERLSGDRIALIGFASEAGLQAPLTRDTAALRELTWQTRPGFLTDPGEGLADALRLAQRRLLRHKQAAYDRVILVLTDGDAKNQQAALEAAKGLRQHNIKLLVVGVGGNTRPAPTKPGRLPPPDLNIPFKPGQKWHNPSWTPIPQKELRLLAQAANGWMWTWSQVGPELSRARQVIQSLGRTARKNHKRKRPKEQYPIAVGLALLFLAIHRGLRP
ncbi:MAG: VWA domain-containing protein [Deltaproteobacteria bacterium]|nr:MAG: VWA domain-containing protein [Deltaproteobacteria bacterium]